jgi:hypothetical protein
MSPFRAWQKIRRREWRVTLVLSPLRCPAPGLCISSCFSLSGQPNVHTRDTPGLSGNTHEIRTWLIGVLVGRIDRASTFALAPVLAMELRCGLSTLDAQRMVRSYACISHGLQNIIWIHSLSVMSTVRVSKSSLVRRAAITVNRVLVETWLLLQSPRIVRHGRVDMSGLCLERPSRPGLWTEGASGLSASPHKSTSSPRRVRGSEGRADLRVVVSDDLSWVFKPQKVQ